MFETCLIYICYRVFSDFISLYSEKVDGMDRICACFSLIWRMFGFLMRLDCWLQLVDNIWFDNIMNCIIHHTYIFIQHEPTPQTHSPTNPPLLPHLPLHQNLPFHSLLSLLPPHHLDPNISINNILQHKLVIEPILLKEISAVLEWDRRRVENK